MKKMLKTVFYATMTIAIMAFGACDDGGGSKGSGDTPIEAPEAPGAARVTPTDSQLTLEWDAVEGAVAYEVWYSETNDSSTAAEVTADTDPTDLSCVITGLSNGTPYYVWLKAKNTAGTSDFGEVSSGTPEEALVAPVAPGAPIVTGSDSQLSLAWTAVDGATAYEVWYSETDNSTSATEFTGDADSTDLSCVITGLENGTEYYIWLKAKSTAGTSGFGEVASGTPEEALIAPVAPGASVVTRRDGQLSLTWSSVDGATWYEVWINDEDAPAMALVPTGGDHVTGASFVVDGLANGTKYYVWIVACNPAGNSDFGEVASGTPDFDPAAVSGLTAQTAADHVTLDWTDPVNFTLDHIEITWTPGGPAEAVSVDPGTQTCDITMTADGAARTFTVTCVFEDETGAAATIESAGVVEISTAAELDDIRNALAAHYILMADIDLNGTAWSPIGTDASRFTGNLNGNGHIISNLTVSGAADYRGLFGSIGAGGGVTSLRLENVSVSGASLIGALAGRNNGTIANCSAAGMVSGTGDYIGGLVGICGGTIDICHTACTVSGNNYVGGLVSKNNGDVSDSYAAGPVSGTQYVGGFAGHIGNDSKAQNFNRCYATGNVTGSYDVGAFLGYNYDGAVNDCYATGNVTLKSAYLNRSLGGLIGYIQSNTVSRCYATGFVHAGGAASVGGLAGDNDGSVTGCYYFQDPDNGIGNRTSSGSMKQQSTYDGWDFPGDSNGTADIWRINANVNNGYPYLVTDPRAVNGLSARTTATSVVLTWADPEAGGFDHIEVTWNGSAVHTVSAGTETYTAAVNADGIARTFIVRTVYANGTIRDAAVCTTGVIEITSAAELANIRNGLAAHYILMADINLSGYAWERTGSAIAQFTGSLNGNGHTISNLTIITLFNSSGFFDSIGSGGRVENLEFTNPSIHPVEGYYIGELGVVAGINNGMVVNCHVTDCTITAEWSSGALIGTNRGTVESCSATGSVTTVQYVVGGLIAENDGGNVSNCYSTCTVEGSSNVGGLIGYIRINGGTVSNSYARGNVTATSTTTGYAGGLAGGSIGTVSNCYATGHVSGINPGGLIGNNRYTNNGYDYYGTEENSYYDSQTTGQSDTGKGEPRTTAQMKMQSTFTGWDFTGETANGTEDIWTISGSVNSGYPYLTDNH